TACSSQHNDTPDAAPDAPAPPPDAAAATVTFSCTPGWDGVQSVDVIGGFGQATDWTAPLVSLSASNGTFSATATLPPGNYLYLCHVVGAPAAGAGATTASRSAIARASPVFAPCPPTSPTFSAAEPTPCSQLPVPADPPVTMFHIRGTVVRGGAAAGGYLV